MVNLNEFTITTSFNYNLTSGTDLHVPIRLFSIAFCIFCVIFTINFTFTNAVNLHDLATASV